MRFLLLSFVLKHLGSSGAEFSSTEGRCGVGQCNGRILEASLLQTRPAQQLAKSFQDVRDDVGYSVQNLTSQLQALQDATPVALNFENSTAMKFEISGHFQGMARLTSGWLGTHTTCSNKCHDYYLPFVANDGTWKTADHMPGQFGYCGGAVAVGNVAAVMYKSQQKERNSVISFYHYQDGVRHDLLEWSIEVQKTATTFGLVYHPRKQKYLLLTVLGKECYTMQWTKYSSLLNSACTESEECWERRRTYCYPGNTNLKEAETIEESGSLLYDSAVDKAYWIYFDRAGSENIFRVFEINADNGYTEKVGQYPLKHSLDHLKTEALFNTLAVFKSGISPEPSWRWAGTAFAEGNGRLVLAASARHVTLPLTTSSLMKASGRSWFVGVWGGSEKDDCSGSSACR